jgi:hypothetical protein
MSALQKPKPRTGLASRGLQDTTSAADHIRNAQEKRAAEHSFLDDAGYAREGEIAKARAAALFALDALDRKARL